MPSSLTYSTLKPMDLIKNCSSGDPLAWSEFINRYKALVAIAAKKRLSLHRYTYNEQDIEDITQNFFIKLWQKKNFESISSAEHLNFWIALASANSATDFLRKAKTDCLTDSESIFQKAVNDENNLVLEKILSSKVKTPRDNYESVLFRQNMDNVISSLKNKEQVVMRLNVFHEMKYEEISKVTKLSIGNISSIIKRAKEKLGKMQ